jgi:myo-inositol catabolism protein IolH
MKFAMDPVMLYNRPLSDIFSVALDIGYPYIELSPREDFLIGMRGQRITLSAVKQIATASEKTGVGIASLMVVYPWSSPDQEIRRAAIESWRQAIAVAIDLGCDRINTEFTGDPSHLRESVFSFWRSAEEILPDLEKSGVKICIEPHPYDFVESGSRAADIIRGLCSEHFGYLYCTPHTFYLGGEIEDQIHSTRDVLGHVHLADTFRPFRIIVNPLGSDVRVHQHLDIGQGEVDWKRVFDTLAAEHFDGVLTVCVFAWSDQGVQSLTRNREAVLKLAGASGLDLSKEKDLTGETIQAAINRMVEGFKPETSAGMDGIIQYCFTGKKGGDWIIRILDQKITSEKGIAKNPDVTVIIDVQDYLDISNGLLDTTKAFMQGKIRIKGDMNILMKMQTLVFPRKR